MPFTEEEKMLDESAKGMACFHPRKFNEEIEATIAQIEALPSGFREELRGRIIIKLNRGDSMKNNCEQNIRILANALMEREKDGMLCPHTTKLLEEITKG